MPTRIDRIDVDELVRTQNAQLIEVLPRAAYEALHLPGALSIPLEELDEDAVRELDPKRPIIVYCYDYQ